MDTRKVAVGETEVVIQPFRAFKAIVVGRLVSQVTDEVRKLFEHVDAEVAKKRDTNKIQITRQMCGDRIADYRAAAETARSLVEKAPEESSEQKTKADLEHEARVFDARAASWEQQLAGMGERDYIELPGTAEPIDYVLAGLPKAFELGIEKQLIQLLALVVIPNADLKRAWKGDDVPAVLEQKGEELLEEADLGQLAEVIVAAWESAEDQLRPQKEALAKLRGLYQRAIGTGATEEETSTTSSPESSTSSDGPTAGESPEPSSALAGAASASSETG